MNMQKMMEVMAQVNQMSIEERTMLVMMIQMSTGASVAPVQAPETPAPAPVEQTPYEKQASAAVRATTTDVKCKWDIEELELAGGKKFYRSVDGIFTAGKWRVSKYDSNKEYRIPTNLEAHRIATDYVKKLQGVKSVTMDAGWIAYGFATKKSAKLALEKLPEMIQRAEISAYIAEHGQIKAKAVTRDRVA